MSKEEKFELPIDYCIWCAKEYILDGKIVNEDWLRFILYLNSTLDEGEKPMQGVVTNTYYCVYNNKYYGGYIEDIAGKKITLEQWISANVDEKEEDSSINSPFIWNGSAWVSKETNNTTLTEDQKKESIFKYNELKEDALKYKVMREIFSSCNGLENIEYSRASSIINSLFQNYKIEKR